MRGIIRELASDGQDVTIADLEAGLEHLKRGTPRHTDVLIVVAEPYWRSLETAMRIVGMGEELEIPRVGVVANKVRDEEDRRLIEGLMAERGSSILAVVPFDDTVTRADRTGRSALDVAATSPAIAAVGELAAVLDGARA